MASRVLCPLRRVLLLAGIALSSPVLAQSADQTPGGLPVTKDTYPAALVDRPITLPAGMISLSVNQQVQFSQDSTQPVGWGLGATAAFGVTSRLELGLTGVATIGGLEDDNQVGGYAIYRLTRNLGVRFAVNFDSGDSENAVTNTDDTSDDDETATVETNNSQTLTFEVGVPLKFRLPRLPIAIGGFDALVDMYVPIVTATSSSPLVYYFGVQTPIYVQYSPFDFLSVEGRFTPQFPVGGQPQENIDLIFEADAFYTRPHFDAGVAFTAKMQDIFGSTDTDNSGWQPTVFTCLAMLTVRI